MSSSLLTDVPDALGNRAGELSDPDMGFHDRAKRDEGFRECRVRLPVTTGPVDPD